MPLKKKQKKVYGKCAEDKMKSKFARFSIRLDDDKENIGTLIIGRNFDLLKPDVVYEITECMGELMLREVGKTCVPYMPSTIDHSKLTCGITWQAAPHDIMENGSHLLTQEELEAREKVRNKS
jgi:hypothetical protein